MNFSTEKKQADEIEFWLDAAGHAPVGPEAWRNGWMDGRGGQLYP